ncbi:MAG: hypothetical protein ACREYF_16580 [Gammaproteobacteria bacterium]
MARAQINRLKGLRAILIYCWALPNTLLGLGCGLLTLVTGGRVRARFGALEFYGGFARLLLSAMLIHARAMTLGHVILGQDPKCLDAARDHEQGHVRQAEIWGPLFLPAYLISSLWALLRGGHFYFDNWFERDAERRRLAKCDPTIAANRP